MVESIAAEAIKVAANAPIETLWRGDEGSGEGSAPGHTAAGAGDAAALAAEKAAAAQLIRGCNDAPAEACSGIAFSASKPGLDFECSSAPKTGVPAPDGVVLLDAESSSSRGGFGHDYNSQKIVRTIA